MSVSYKRLFHLLVEQDMSGAELRKLAGFSANIMTRIRNNKYVSLESLEHICRVLQCKLDDILEFEPDETYAEREAEMLEYRKKHYGKHRFHLHKSKKQDP